MKKYSIIILCLTALLSQSLLFGDSKYERLLADLDAQNLPRLKKDLQDGEYLSPKLYRRLLDEAKEIHECLQKKLSIWSDPRDLLRVVVGVPLTVVCGLCCIEMIDVAVLRDPGDRALISHRGIGYDEKWLSLCLAIGASTLTSLSAYATSRGYKLTYGRMPVDTAKAIVRLFEKSRHAESGTKASQAA